MASITINVENLLKQVKKDLDWAKSYHDRLTELANGFAESNVTAQAFVASVRYNREYRMVYLERAAAVLQAIGLFNEDSGDVVSAQCLRDVVARLESYNNAAKVLGHSDLETTKAYLGIKEEE